MLVIFSCAAVQFWGFSFGYRKRDPTRSVHTISRSYRRLFGVTKRVLGTGIRQQLNLERLRICNIINVEF